MLTIPFDKISLQDIGKVKLMNRVDYKYRLWQCQLPDILNSIKNDYYIMDINGETEQVYSTDYFDTSDDSMYLSHHNGKLNRYKVRKRTYQTSGDCFLEVKFKNNKLRTIKDRIESIANQGFSNGEKEFLQYNCPFCADDLQPVLRNTFTRITLVNKNYNERCTIDYNLKVKSAGRKFDFQNLVIIEIKMPNGNASSPLKDELKKHKILPSGFSKYCIGRTVTDSSLKNNAFKKTLLKLDEKISIN